MGRWGWQHQLVELPIRATSVGCSNEVREPQGATCAPGEEQSQAGQAGGQLAGKLRCRKGPRVPGGPEADHEPATCPQSKGGNQPARLH